MGQGFTNSTINGIRYILRCHRIGGQFFLLFLLLHPIPLISSRSKNRLSPGLSTILANQPPCEKKSDACFRCCIFHEAHCVYCVTSALLRIFIFTYQASEKVAHTHLHTYVHYMYIFFLDKLRKFTISDFPKQTHFGHILITLFFFFTL